MTWGFGIKPVVDGGTSDAEFGRNCSHAQDFYRLGVGGHLSTSLNCMDISYLLNNGSPLFNT